MPNKLLPKGKRRMVEAIQLHLADPERYELTDKQEELLLRLKAVNNMMLKDAPQLVANKTMDLYDVSEATAWRYQEYARQVYNAVSTARDAEFGMRLVMDWAFEARQMAVKQEDVKSYVSLIRALIDAFNIKDFDPAAIDPDELKQHNYFLTLNITHPDGVERKQSINLNELEKLPEEQRAQFINDIQEEMIILDPEEEITEAQEVDDGEDTE